MIKLEYLGELRKIKKVSNYLELLRVIRDKFEDLRAIDSSYLKLTYLDTEKDLISISSNEDLDEAYN